MRATWVVAAVMAAGCSAGPAGGGDGAGGFASLDPFHPVTSRGEGGAGGAGPAFSPEVDQAGLVGVPERKITLADGDRLYDVDEEGLEILDVARPEAGRRLGTWWPDGPIVDLAVRDSVAFVVVGAERQSLVTAPAAVVALDVGDPAHVAPLGRLSLPAGERIDGAAFAGDFLRLVVDTPCLDRPCADPGVAVLAVALADARDLRVAARLPLDLGGRRLDAVAFSASRVLVGAGQDDVEIHVVDAADGHLRASATVSAGDSTSRWYDARDDVLRVLTVDTRRAGPPSVRFATYDLGVDPPRRLADADLTRDANGAAPVRLDGDRLLLGSSGAAPGEMKVLDAHDPAHPAVLTLHGAPVEQVLGTEALGDVVGVLEAATADHPPRLAAYGAGDATPPAALGEEWIWPFADPHTTARPQVTLHAVPEAGLFVVTFAGMTYDDAACRRGFAAGLRLFDVDPLAGLRARGTTAIGGLPRSVLYRDGRLLLVGDDRIEAVDVTDPDAPRLLGATTRARRVVDVAPVGDGFVELRRDWWSGEPALEVTRADARGRTATVGHFDLDDVRDAACRPGWPQPFPDDGARVFADGTTAWLVWREAVGAGERLATFDVSDAAAPRLLADVTLAGDWRRPSAWHTDGATPGDAIVRVGPLLVARVETAADAAHLELVDLRDPAHPAARPLPIAGADWIGPLTVASDTVLTVHRTPVEGRPGYVHFWLDRVDLSDPAAPRVRPPVEIPGVPVAFDAASGRLVTVEDGFSRRFGADPAGCEAPFAAGDAGALSAASCSVEARALDLVAVGDDAAVRRARAAFPGSLDSLGASATRAFVTYWPDPPADARGSVVTPLQLVVLAGLADGRLETTWQQARDVSVGTTWGERVLLAPLFGTLGYGIPWPDPAFAGSIPTTAVDPGSTYLLDATDPAHATWTGPYPVGDVAGRTVRREGGAVLPAAYGGPRVVSLP